MSVAQQEARGGGGERSLSHDEKVNLALLALPSISLAFAITVLSSYLAVVARGFTSSTAMIGLIVGSEGLMALWVPLVVGPWSDQLETPLGGRLPFVIAGGLPAAAALIIVGVGPSLVVIAIAAAAFFVGYFVAYEPYRAMYPDLVDEEHVAGRAQSSQAIARGLGTGLALLGGGLLLSVARIAPFAFAGIVTIAGTAGFAWLMLRRGTPRQQRHAPASPRETAQRLRRLIGEHRALRMYFIANALWELTLAALKAFVILYLTRGLGIHLASASLIVGATAVVILVGALLAGKIGDRVGPLRLVSIALWFYGLGFIVPAVTQTHWVIVIAVPFIAIGGGAIMTLAYAILMPLMPPDEHGALTGYYSLSRGLGIVGGPVIAGLLIQLLRHGLFSTTQGFAAMWIVCAAGALGSIPFVRAMAREQRAAEAEDRRARDSARQT